jgi:prepilin-type N-terminal cleavage/methylation domain-containing protein
VGCTKALIPLNESHEQTDTSHTSVVSPKGSTHMNAMLTRMSNEEGFTLIELMIVMVVLGILAGIVLFAVGPFQSSATKSKANTNSSICATANAAAAADATSLGGNGQAASAFAPGC